ncbi:MAG: T9SS type A sorting domain-containing protein [Chitinophagales bacterium]|nr:T9SS type A sorting domain-containing protein [Chitinophagales bacterium]
MKNSLLFLALLIAVVGNGQSIIPTPNDSASASATITDPLQDIDIHIWLINNTNSSVEFTWLLKDYSTPAGWDVKCCDNNNCYYLLLNPGPFVTLPVGAGDTMDMKFQFTTYCKSGTGTANMVVYLDGDSANTDLMLHFRGNATVNCANSITDITDRQVSFFPNPAADVVTVQSQGGNFSEYEIRQLNGTVAAGGTMDGNGQISVSKLNNGIYQIILYRQGQYAGTQKFCKTE